MIPISGFVCGIIGYLYYYYTVELTVAGYKMLTVHIII